MIILGIDPGSRKTGWAVIEVQGKKFKYIASGVHRFDKIPEFLDRLADISESTKNLVAEYEPNEVALESLIYVQSIPSLAKLAQARGALIAGLSEKYKKKIFEYSPNLIKSSVAGHGHAAKEGVEKTLKMIFGNIKFKTNDESDALAIALCHALNRGKGRGQSPKKKGQLSYSKGRTLKQVFSK
ncbi:crossover junction endodeoxyribonuclease RuvC [Bacteriovorax sp. DB6_IX]|uniref:crossover junction endodeoxyribonuclease RuvC n=1 Tax=Bacteriovorax sp. DB6_IX TaxID=1353530 RepID=UPI00038A09CC|nr:crossover junction endodeoxyribonuclease RuvC [Bacteriovorax sp. DB6_IX]EQC51437.1 crossover junction endodeoxyribonuclease RuvC [Bacteriovorax sp. DB6_IX]